MRDFITIDFETGNSQRVSACALGYAKVCDCKIVETKGYIIKPIGGHAPFQSKIHGIKDAHTYNKPVFGDLFEEIRDIFYQPLVGHSLFDQQVLIALSNHFNLDLRFNYIDSCAIAKAKLPNLKDHKLKTLAKYFRIPEFRHHDAEQDAIACANIFLNLQYPFKEEATKAKCDDVLEFKGMAMGILADDEVNYKEAYQLLYWLEDHIDFSKQHQNLYLKAKEVLEDDTLDYIESVEIKRLLEESLRRL